MSERTQIADAKARAVRTRIRIGWALLALIVVVVLAAPWLLLALAFWSADGSWDFEGPGVRHFLFVRGSHLARLGTVEPTREPVRYSVRLPEGTFPGWRIAIFDSTAEPTTIARRYAERCEQLGFKVTQMTLPEAAAARAVLVCEIEMYIDVEMAAERAANQPSTRVALKVWGYD